MQLGHALKESGDLSAADEAYEQARKLRPHDADLLLNLGRLRKLQGRVNDAIDLFRESYETDRNEHAVNEIKLVTGQQRLHMEVDGFDADRRKVLLSGFLDPQWYIERYPDVPPSYMTPLDHYMAHGAYEGRSPGPNFDGAWYLAQYPDLAVGAAARTLNPLLHYLDHGAVEGRKPAPPKGVLPAVRALLDSVFDLEPQIYANDRFSDIRALHIADGLVRSKPFSAFKRVFQGLERPYDTIICVPWLIHGGADLVAMHLARAAVEKTGKRSVLVLACDYPRTDAMDWLPQGADFAMLPDTRADLNLAERVEALLLLIQVVRPKRVVNVNSHACWELMRSHGLALSNLTALYGCAFCRDFTSDDRPAGYADTHLRDALPNLAGVILDNAAFADFLFDHFGFPAAMRRKMIVLRQPAPLVERPKLNGRSQHDLFVNGVDGDFKVFWASRFARQKNVRLLAAIVRAAPDIGFEVWGRGEGEHEQVLRQCAAGAPNLVLKGAYDRFGALPVADYGAFLYTSLWDGIPNVLLEAAAADVAIVASHVGGIRELVNGETGWLIEDHEAPAAYVTALRQIRSDAAEARRRRAQMQALLKANHSWSSYLATLDAQDFFGKVS